jgi:hypothetical protein
MYVRCYWYVCSQQSRRSPRGREQLHDRLAARQALQADAKCASVSVQELFQSVNSAVCNQVLSVAQQMHDVSAATSPQVDDTGPSSVREARDLSSLGRQHDRQPRMQTEGREHRVPYAPPRLLTGRSHLRGLEERDAWLASLATQPHTSPSHAAAAHARYTAEPGAAWLEVAPSAVQHERAGLGLWLRGSMGTGDVAALHPGVVYSQAYHT